MCHGLPAVIQDYGRQGAVGINQIPWTWLHQFAIGEHLSRWKVAPSPKGRTIEERRSCFRNYEANSSHNLHRHGSVERRQDNQECNYEHNQYVFSFDHSSRAGLQSSLDKGLIRGNAVRILADCRRIDADRPFRLLCNSLPDLFVRQQRDERPMPIPHEMTCTEWFDS